MENKTEDLFTAADVKRVRAMLIAEQASKCKLTGIAFDAKQFHLDHKHDEEQLVRAALYKQSNMMLGKLENMYIRYLSFWYPDDLPTFLRQAATYLELEQDRRWRHPDWIKKVQTKFNALPEARKKQVLVELGAIEGANAKERKILFKQQVLQRQHSFEQIMQAINKAKE